MNPPPSLPGLRSARLQSERRDAVDSAVASSLQTMLPLSVDAEAYGRWKLAARLAVALPIMLWLLMKVLD